MSEGVFGLPRVLDDGVLKRGKTVAFGTAGVAVTAKNGRVYHVFAVNKSAATAYFLQLHDKATAPTAGNVPVWEVKLPANLDGEMDFGIIGFYLALGFGLAISTTAGSLTFAAADDCVAYFQYTVVS